MGSTPRSSLIALALLGATSLLAGFDSTSTRHPSSQPGGFGIEDLREIVRTRDVRTIEQLLPLLPLDMRRNFTLMHHSKSLQEASPRHPRAIMFTPDGKFMATFNGKREQKGFHEMEIADFDFASSQLALYRMAFDPAGQRPPVIEGPNPRKCAACHGDMPRYIFSEYNRWEGAYGQRDDVLDAPPPARPEFLAYPLDLEGPEFLEFKDRATRVGSRYAALDLRPDDLVWPYSQSRGARSLARMPNARLFALIASNFGRQLAAVVARHPRYSDLKYSIAFYGLCQNHSGYSDPGHIESLRLRTEAIRNEDLSLVNSDSGLLDNGPYGLDGLMRSLGVLLGRRALSGTTPLLNPRESRMSTHWSTGASDLPSIIALAIVRLEQANPSVRAIWRWIGPRPSPASYFSNTSITNAGPYPQDEARFYLSDLTMPAYSNRQTSLGTEPCDQLQSLSLRELATPMTASPRFPIPPSPPIVTFGDGPTILERRLCVGCHDPAGLAIGPAIPFGQPERLREYIAVQRLLGNDFVDKTSKRLQSEHNNPIQLARRMPLGAEALPPSERETLLNYLHRLSTP